MRDAWIEISLDAIKNNIQQLRNCVGDDIKICSVIKANACGHGAVQIGHTLLAHGSDMLGVANIDEAMAIRDVGINCPLLIVGYSNEFDYEVIVFSNISQTIFSLEQAIKINEAAKFLDKKAKIHLKIDCGMGRIGFQIADYYKYLPKILRLAYVDIEGVFMHPPMADSTDLVLANEQLKSFKELIKFSKKQGLVVCLYHASNSAAILNITDSHLNMVRSGASVYGYYSSEFVAKDKLRLMPAMSVKARIIQLKEVEKDTRIGFWGEYITTKDKTMIATIPIGFGDGYWKNLTNKSYVLVRGKRVPIIGKITMDMMMIDVSDFSDISLKEEVVLIGKQLDEFIWADELAALGGGYEFELMAHLGLRLKKYYI